ncbi:MAG TPA: hypothetical protein VKE70_33950, partial [Candidatus Solibacter sp.]|nr:hypothetical protein [Candidatus Solibacter sp.]
GPAARFSEGLDVEAGGSGTTPGPHTARHGYAEGWGSRKMCESLGYLRYGEVPNYARCANGQLHATVFFYRELL